MVEECNRQIRLEEEIEGDRGASADYVFRRIGESVPLLSSDSSFDLNNPPFRPLAVSDRFGSLFLAHLEGFLVARTKDVIGVAKEIKEKGKGPCIKESSVVDVRIGRVSVLALSSDSSTLAAAVGGDIHLFSVRALLNKDKKPSFSCSLNESDTVKDLKWQKGVGMSFVVLSGYGTLYHGHSNEQLKDVMKNVDSVDWSMQGDFIAVARKDSLTILSANFKEQICMSLLFQSWHNDTDSGSSIKVDSVGWVRHDSIIVGCVRLNEDGDEDGYLVQVITDRVGKFIEELCQPVVFSFPDLFEGILYDILPNGFGPHLLLSYLDRWELVLASNKKTVDQHVLLLKWFLNDERREVLSLEFQNDKYTPRIDLRENGDDNLILGFGVEKVSLFEKMNVQVGAEFVELSPQYILLCLTAEGKLILYHVASISDPSELPQSTTLSLESELPATVSGQSDLVKEVDESPALHEGEKLKSTGRKDITLHEEENTLASMSRVVDSFKTDGGLAIPLSGGKLFGADTLNNKSLIFTSGGPALSNIKERTGTGVENNSSFHLQNSFSAEAKTFTSSKGFTHEPSSMVIPSTKPFQIEGRTSSMLRSGNVETVPASIGSLSSVQEGFAAGKSQISSVHPSLGNARIHKPLQMFNSEKDLSKQFYNVKDMANELDTLLSYIEQEGGFRDACTVFQQASVLTLEKDLRNISQISQMCKNKVHEQLMKIQDLFNKKLQVSARKIYMQGIVRQASNSQYWDIWNRQKLNPEFELKRQHILKANQNLTNQLIELERHFNTLEINRFGEFGRAMPRCRALQVNTGLSRRTQSVHSVYNTLNSQLAAAEQLSEVLSKQIATLKISSPSVKRGTVAKELFESIGLGHETSAFQSPDIKRPSFAPDSLNSSRKEYPRRSSPGSIKGFEPETARRRRESLDRSWSSLETQKTTVKRMTRQERFSVSGHKPFKSSKETFDSQMKAIVQKDSGLPASSFSESSASKSQLYPLNEGGKEKLITQASEFQQNSVFKWARDFTGSSQNLGSKSHSLEETARIAAQQSKQMVPSQSHSKSAVMRENVTSSEITRFTQLEGQANSLTFENITKPKTISNLQLETSKPALTSSKFPGNLSPMKTTPLERKGETTLNLKIGEDGLSKSSSGSMKQWDGSLRLSQLSQEGSISALSSTSVNALEKAAQMDTLTIKEKSPETVSTKSTVLPPFLPVSLSDSNISSGVATSMTSSLPASSSSVMTPGRSSLSTRAVEENSQIASISSSLLSVSESPILKCQTLHVAEVKSRSEPTPVAVNEVSSDLTRDHSRPELVGSGSAASELSIGLISGTEPNLLPTVSGNLFSPSSNSSPQIPSTASFVSTETKENIGLDVTSSQEDEMEEEAPDTSTVLNLGSLGGFGLGSAPPPSQPKSNPFGGSFITTNASSASSPNFLTVAPGELFRPSSLSLPSAQPVQPSQPMNSGPFASNFSGGLGGFGQPAQIGAGQHALGSVLGAFGQSRQLGAGVQGMGFAPSGGFGGGFSSAANTGGFGGFSSAATGGGFAAVSSSGPGFAGAATGGFAAVASGSGGFAGAARGFAAPAAASNTGGFAAAALTGSSFGGAGQGGGFMSGGFGGFGGNQGSGFSAFGGSNAGGPGRPPSDLLTQMRK
ncbi:nuclear pore complex protein NUP214 isoform X2 [Typha angustifolia]|uniref:nuclear pore complex protein NUP214 isoform X2 n=1 Tax=Typha angustifolia TaxID=59011 RepID=UPI003C302100